MEGKEEMKTLCLGALQGYSDARLRTLIARRLKADKKEFQSYTILVAYEEELDWCRGFFFLLRNKTSNIILEVHGYQDSLTPRYIIPHSEYFNTLTFLHLNINGKQKEEMGEFRNFLNENLIDLSKEPLRLKYFNHSTNLDIPEGEKTI